MIRNIFATVLEGKNPQIKIPAFGKNLLQHNPVGKEQRKGLEGG